MLSRLRANLRAPATAALAILLLMAGNAPARNPLERDPVEILACMERANEQRRARLQPFISDRVYRAANSRFRRSATVVAEVRHSAGEKSFRIVSQSGSRTIQKRVIEPLLAAECQNARPEARAQTDICRRNYDFEFVEVDAENASYVFRVRPRTPHRYLFQGEVWVDAETCGIRRLAGEPAVSPSFWVKKTVFFQEYGRFADDWLPRRHRTEVQLRIFGHSTLEIDYRGYLWQPQSADSRISY